VKNRGAALDDAATSILAGSQWSGDRVLSVGAGWPPGGATAFYHITCRTRGARRSRPVRSASAQGRKSCRRHCGKTIEAQPSGGKIAPSTRLRRSRAGRPLGRRPGDGAAGRENRNPGVRQGVYSWTVSRGAMRPSTAVR
jgi:hypothetical protein